MGGVGERLNQGSDEDLKVAVDPRGVLRIVGPKFVLNGHELGGSACSAV